MSQLNFYLSQHPSVINFRWSPTDTWFSTWSFLAASISAYAATSAALHIHLRRQKPVPLGPIPALHSLATSLLSAAVFAGILLSSAAEIRDTRWLRHRSGLTPFQWLLCFPLGTRPSGRVFFWSYAFYLSRFVHIFRTFCSILKNPAKFPYFQVLSHSILICTSFLWLEFSQSFQILAIISMTLVFTLVYGYRFCTEIGILGERCLPIVIFCSQIGLAVANLAWHVGVLVLYYSRGGCNGMGAWVFNAVLNSFVFLFVLNFYLNKCLCEKDFSASEDEGKAATSELSYKLLRASPTRYTKMA